MAAGPLSRLGDRTLRQTWPLGVAIVMLLMAAAIAVVVGDDRPDDLVPDLDLPGTAADDDPGPFPAERTLAPYEGLGVWIDAFDFGPAYQPSGRRPPIDAAVIPSLAARGVNTIYLQTHRDDERSPGGIVDADLVADFLVTAHEAGIAVVAWYLPKHTDVSVDMAILKDMHELSVDGHRFDGIALDIEANQSEPDPDLRNRRLLQMSRQLRDLVGDDPIGGIVVPPVLMTEINPAFWPGFPWKRLAPLYDVWLPMAYWTFRTQASGYRDPARYVEENVAQLRGLVGQQPIHVIGGVADVTGEDEHRVFTGAVLRVGAIGGSVYDLRTTDEGEWAWLLPLADLSLDSQPAEQPLP